MSEEKGTTFENKCAILSDLWMSYRSDKEFEDFISYNDIGLPLAFLVDDDLARPQPMGKRMIEETFDLLLASMKLEDTGFESLDDLFVG